MRNLIRVILRIVLSPKIAILAFTIEISVASVGLILERNVWLSYYDQEFTIAPPIVVLTSDDWGGGEAPQETPRDLDRLANMLRGFQDCYGNHPVITAYMNPAEPDFAGIAKSQYRVYSWRFCYTGRPKLTAKWRSLCNDKLFEIQFHGREHWNIPLWLSLLQEDAAGFREACRLGQIPYRESQYWQSIVARDRRLTLLKRSFVDASTNPPRALPVEKQIQMVRSGVQLLEEHLGVRPIVAVAPGHVWDTNTCKALAANGIWFLESTKVPITVVGPDLRLSVSEKHWHYGCNVHGVRPIVRTLNFEPTEQQVGPKTVKDLMWNIRRNLAMRMPLVLQTHKQHYVGHDMGTSDQSISRLEALIGEIQAESPDCAFLSSSDLAKYIYGAAEEVQRKVPFKLKKLSGFARISHSLRCLWIAHSKFRLMAYATIVGFLWCLLTITMRLMRRRIHHFQRQGESSGH